MEADGGTCSARSSRTRTAVSTEPRQAALAMFAPEHGIHVVLPDNSGVEATPRRIEGTSHTQQGQTTPIDATCCQQGTYGTNPDSERLFYRLRTCILQWGGACRIAICNVRRLHGCVALVFFGCAWIGSVDDIADGLGMHRNEAVKYTEEVDAESLLRITLTGGRLHYQVDKVCG